MRADQNQKLQDVLIFGVGRSGTTMLYSLCQEIFRQRFGDTYRSIYEPFIWNPEIFNAPYDETLEFFGKTGSVSIEGIYNHIHTPMFVADAASIKLPGDGFYDQFRRKDSASSPRLAKLIRGNGRMALFRYLNPGARFVLMIRNPIDVVNSVKYKFSFFGDDFYPSDFPRFCEELRCQQALTIDPKSAKWAEKQAEYCHQMNRAAVEFAAADSATLVFEYDHLANNKEQSVHRLLEFLEVSTAPEYEHKLASPTGATTASITLSETEFASIARYEILHDELCRNTGVKRGRTSTQVLEHYQGNCAGKDYDQRYDGLVSNPLRRIIWQQNARIAELEKRL